MVTNKEMDFSAYNQSLTFFKLGLLCRILVEAFRFFKLNTSSYKLDFFEKMLNFLRLTGMDALSKNIPEEQINSPHLKLDELFPDSSSSQSFIEFLFHFRIIIYKKNNFVFNERYKRLFGENITDKVISNQGFNLPKSLSKKERRMLEDFLFIYDLLKKYDNPEYAFQHITQKPGKWELLISEKKLDYEIRLCETLYNLKDYKLNEKIASPFNEDYYTESGQNAFKNFTRFAFIDYLKQIKPVKDTLKVLDLGCGYGNYIDAIKNSYPNSSITGIELNPEVSAAAKTKFEGAENIEIINGNFFKFSTKSEYNIVLMNYVLFYFTFEEKKEVLRKAKSMISDEGSIIICQYFSGIENLKKKLARKQNDYSLSRRIEMYYSNKVLYANSLWNDAVDTFSEAVKWNEFRTILAETGLTIESMVKADKFYYSFFVELKRTKES